MDDLTLLKDRVEGSQSRGVDGWGREWDSERRDKTTKRVQDPSPNK